MICRHILVLCIVLAGCGSVDDTPVWSPSVLPQPYVGPSSGQPPDSARTGPRLGPKRSIDSEPSSLKSPEPSVRSNEPLPSDERRALQGERQSLNAEIRALERRESFDTDRFGERGERHSRVYDERRLRQLERRKRDVLRRLRGG